MSGPVDLVIVGAGGHGRELLDIVEACGDSFRFIGFLDDGEIDQSLLARRGARLLGPSALLGELSARYLIGIGAGDRRRAIEAQARAAGRVAASIAHPLSSIGGDTTWDEGFVLCPAATVTTNIRFGRHCHVNRNATVGHDCRIGDYVTINPGASVSGNVTIGDGAMIGTGAAVIQGVTIGAGAVIGAGAAVVDDIPPGATAVGVPARPRPVTLTP